MKSQKILQKQKYFENAHVSIYTFKKIWEVYVSYYTVSSQTPNVGSNKYKRFTFSTKEEAFTFFDCIDSYEAAVSLVSNEKDTEKKATITTEKTSKTIL